MIPHIPVEGAGAAAGAVRMVEERKCERDLAIGMERGKVDELLLGKCRTKRRNSKSKGSEC